VIPFLDLKAQYHSIKPEIDEAVLNLLESTQYVLGSEVAAFENDFAAYCGTKHAVGVNSGTSALHLALLAAGVGPGDEVITVPFSFVATVAAICYTGARPVFVDVDPVTLTMDPVQVEAVITPRTKAVLPVHLYGQPADMDPIVAAAARHGLAVIEDAAQAHGAEYRGRRVGSIGQLGCFSFYPGKNLGACGEGGMVVTNDDAQAKTLRMLRDWGQEQRYHHVLRGFNYRLEGLQGAILRVKLRHLETWTEARRRHAHAYDELLAGSDLRAVPARSDVRHVYHLYVVRHPERDAIQRLLGECGVQSGLHYPIPVHLQTAYADLGCREGEFPVSERAAREVLSLPMFAELTPAQIEEVASVVTRVATVG